MVITCTLYLPENCIRQRAPLINYPEWKKVLLSSLGALCTIVYKHNSCAFYDKHNQQWTETNKVEHWQQIKENQANTKKVRTLTVSFQWGELLWYKTDVLYSETNRSPDPALMQCCAQTEITAINTYNKHAINFTRTVTCAMQFFTKKSSETFLTCWEL